MVQKSEFTNGIMTAVLYVVTTTFWPVLAQIETWKRSGDPALIQQANDLSLGYFVPIVAFFIFMIIYKIYLKIHYLKLANRFPRQNMTIITNTGMYFEEGVGLVDHKQVVVSDVKVEECIKDEEITKMFTEQLEWLAHFHKVEADKLKHTITKDRVIFEIPEPDFNWSSYKIEDLKTKSLDSFLSPKEISFLATKGVDSVEKFLCVDMPVLKEYEREYERVNKEVLTNLDFKHAQVLLENTVGIFNNKEIDFLRTKGIHTMQDFISADLVKLSKDFNDNFKQEGFINHLKTLWKKFKNEEYQADDMDFSVFLPLLKERIVEKNRQFHFRLSANGKFKFMFLNLSILKSIHYDYHAYIMIFDKKIVINVGKTYKAGESFEKFMKGEEEWEDMDDVITNRALTILPSSLDNTYKYSPGILASFHGVRIECEQLTEAEYIYRGMLDSDHVVLLCNNCSYLREAMKVRTLVDPLNIQKIERLALLDVLNESITQREATAKLRDLQDSRLRRKDDENEMIFAKLIEDINALEVGQKFINERKPINTFFAVILVGVFILGLLIGLVLTGAISSVMQQSGDVAESAMMLLASFR